MILNMKGGDELFDRNYYRSRLALMGLSQTAFCDKYYWDPTYLSKIVNGKTDARASTVKRLAENLDCSIDGLLGHEPGKVKGEVSTDE